MHGGMLIRREMPEDATAIRTAAAFAGNRT
jgi:hypothetical protein